MGRCQRANVNSLDHVAPGAAMAMPQGKLFWCPSGHVAQIDPAKRDNEQQEGRERMICCLLL